MRKRKQLLKKYLIHPAVPVFLGMLLVTALVFILADSGKIRMVSILLWTGIFCMLWFLGTETRLHKPELAGEAKWKNGFLLLLAAVLILGCVLPMGIPPEWNGEEQNHRDQYERMAESILEGHIYMDYDIDPRLLAMENPYDVGLRETMKIDYKWDHAFYNGKYYMYFGIVPVFLLYLPYRLVTGAALTGYKGTQVFTAVAMVGMFLLMKLLAKVFFKKMRFATYASLAAALSLLSLWYSSTTASLYCTAISAAIMLMVWNLYFFVKAVWDTENLNKQILLAFCGSWCGALAFGCRPPVALANLLIVPLLVTFLKQQKMNGKLFGKLCFAASPYVFVAAVLMWYNYVRFENPFEFGQAYQLTNTDQSAYGSLAANLDFARIFKGIWENFLQATPFSDTFPYVNFSGALINFPILGLSLAALHPAVRRKIKDSGLGGWVLMLAAVPLIITVIDIQWAPFLTERYRMDIYFVIAILCFVVVGFWDASLKTEEARTRFSKWIAVFAFLTVFTCIVFWFIPNDANAVVCNEQILHWAERLFMLDPVG